MWQPDQFQWRIIWGVFAVAFLLSGWNGFGLMNDGRLITFAVIAACLVSWQGGRPQRSLTRAENAVIGMLAMALVCWVYGRGDFAFRLFKFAIAFHIGAVVATIDLSEHDSQRPSLDPG